MRIAEPEVGDQNIGDVELADSDSDQDVDYSPDEASDQDVLEYDSQAEVGIVMVDSSSLLLWFSSLCM